MPSLQLNHTGTRAATLRTLDASDLPPATKQYARTLVEAQPDDGGQISIAVSAVDGARQATLNLTVLSHPPPPEPAAAPEAAPSQRKDGR